MSKARIVKLAAGSLSGFAWSVNTPHSPGVAPEVPELVRIEINFIHQPNGK